MDGTEAETIGSALDSSSMCVVRIIVGRDIPKTFLENGLEVLCLFDLCPAGLLVGVSLHDGIELFGQTAVDLGVGLDIVDEEAHGTSAGHGAGANEDLSLPEETLIGKLGGGEVAVDKVAEEGRAADKRGILGTLDPVIAHLQQLAWLQYFEL